MSVLICPFSRKIKEDQPLNVKINRNPSIWSCIFVKSKQMFLQICCLLNFVLETDLYLRPFPTKNSRTRTQNFLKLYNQKTEISLNKKRISPNHKIVSPCIFMIFDKIIFWVYTWLQLYLYVTEIPNCGNRIYSNNKYYFKGIVKKRFLGYKRPFSYCK